MIMNNLVKKAFSTGLHIAVFAGEKLHEAMGNIIEKSKTIQERYNTEAEEADEEEEVVAAKKATAKSKKAEAKSKEAEAESIKDEEAKAESEEQDSEAKPSRWEEYEHKLRRLVETAISKFNFIRNDDHSRMEERISILEEKLSYIAQLVADQNEESSK